MQITVRLKRRWQMFISVSSYLNRTDPAMKFSIESTSSYNSIHPAYCYTEQFNNNVQIYHEGTKWFGIFLAFLSGTFFTVSSALVKAIKNVDPMILLAIRACLQIIAMVIVACKESQVLMGPKGQKMLIQFQGVVGGLTLSLLYYSFRRLPLGDATTIIFSSPVIVIVLSFFFLKEPCGVLRVMVIGTLMSGVILVSRPPFIFHDHKSHPYDIIGYLCALLGTLFTALNIVVMRKCLEIHYSIIVLHLSLWSLISAVIFHFFVPSNDLNQIEPPFPDDWWTWLKIVAVAMTGLSGQVFVAKALKIEGAGKVSVTRSLDIILSYIVQVYFFGEVPNRSNIFGASLVLLSVICIGFEKEIYRICDFVP